MSTTNVLRRRLSSVLRSALALTFAAWWSLALAVGPGAGLAFAQTVAPVEPPPVSLLGTSTIVSDTGVVITEAGATAAGTTAITAGGVETAAAATGICAAATLGTCAVAAVVVAGVAYGAYKAIRWGWGGHHTPPPPTINTQDTWTSGVTVNSYSIGSTSTVNITFAGGSWNFSLWEVNGSGAITGNCGQCSGSLGYANPTTMTITATSGSGVSGIILCNGSGSLVAKYGTATTSLCGAASGSITHSTQTTTYPAGTNNPQTVKMDVACMDGSGGISHAVTTSAVFHPADTSIPDTAAVPCPNGTVPKDATVTEHDNTNNTDTTVETVTAPQLQPSNPCSAAGAACRPLWQVKNAQGTYVDYVPDTGLTMANAPDPKRCEWENPTVTPETDGGTLPNSDCAAIYSQPAATPSDESCVPTGTAAFNPLEWVYKPVKCVLVWAFEPPAGYVAAQADSLKSSFDASPPGVVATTVYGVFGAFSTLSDSSDCNGPAFPLSDIDASWPDIHPIEACDGLGAALYTGVHPFIVLAVWMAALFTAAKLVLSAINVDWPW